VEAVEYFLLPLPAPYKVSRFRVCFPFQLFSSKCSYFHKNLTASTASSFHFHIAAAYFLKNASTSGSSKSQMLPNLLPLSASFYKLFPLPQKFNRFRFHILGFNHVDCRFTLFLFSLETIS